MEFEDNVNELIKAFEDIDKIIEEITNEKETQDFLIDVLQDQLFTSGEDGNGLSLGDYSPVTIQIKKAKGQPTDRITLKDTGDFYSSYFVTAFKGGFIIDADGQKPTGNLFTRFGDDILLPNDETLTIISEYYEDKLIEYFTNLFQG